MNSRPEDYDGTSASQTAGTARRRGRTPVYQDGLGSLERCRCETL